MIALFGGDDTFRILSDDLFDFFVRFVDHLFLFVGNEDIVHGKRRAVEGRVFITARFDRVEHLYREPRALRVIHVLDHFAQLFIVHLLVYVVDFVGHFFVEREDARRRFDHFAVVRSFLDGRFDRSLPFDAAVFGGHARFVAGAETPSRTLRIRLNRRHIVDAEHHVLRRIDDRIAVCGIEQVARRKHERPALHLRRLRQRHVNRHLVAVEVRVERFARERVQFDRFAFDEYRFEGENAEPVQRRRAVQHNRMFAHDFIEDRVHFRRFLFDKRFRFFDIEHDVFIDEFFHDKRLEEFERHLCRKSALPQVQFRPDNDDRTPRIIDALSEQVLAEAPLLSFQHIADRFERTVRRAFYDALSFAVVEERIDCFLQHTLFVSDDDIGCRKLLQPL